MAHFESIAASQAVEDALRAATHLTAADAAAVAALRVLAKKVDALDDTAAGVSEDGEITEDRKKGLDNVTMPTFLKFCSELGLTPAGRRALLPSKPKRARSNLQGLRQDYQAPGLRAVGSSDWVSESTMS